MDGGQNSLPLIGPLVRAVRIAFGVALLAAVFIVLGSSGAFASPAPSAPTDANSQPSPHLGLLSGILNPVANIVDGTISQVPVVRDITGSDTVGKILEPVTGLADHVENTVTSVPAAEPVVAPMSETAATVVPPLANVVSEVTTPDLSAADQTAAPVMRDVSPVVAPVAAAVVPIVAGGTDTIAGVTGGPAGVVGQVVDNVVAPAVPAIPAVPGVTVPPVLLESPTPDTPVAPAPPVAPELPATPGVPDAPEEPGVPTSSGNADVVAPGDGSLSGAGSDIAVQNPPAQPAPAEFTGAKLNDHNNVKAAAEPKDVADRAPAAVTSSDALARFMGVGVIPGTTTTASVPAQTMLTAPSGGAAAVTCGAETGTSAVGPCAPAMASGPASGPSAGMSSGGPGGSSGSAASHENHSEYFHLAGGAAALPNADWPLPASMPSNPGSTPG